MAFLAPPHQRSGLAASLEVLDVVIAPNNMADEEKERKKPK
jgi:hypothetical protein